MNALSALASATVAAIVCAAAPAAAQATIATSLVSINQPAGLRGDTVTYRTELRASGCQISGVLVDYYVCHDAAPNWRYLGTGCTNSYGRTSINYTIPTNVFADNIHLLAVSRGNSTYAPSSRTIRIAVGRRP